MKEFQKDDGSPWWEIVGQATGVKPSHTDVYTAAIFKTKDTKERIANANKLYTDIFYERDANGDFITPTEQEKQEAYDKAVAKRKNIYEEAILDYKAYMLTSPSTDTEAEKNIFNSMKKGGFTPDEIRDISNGIIPEFTTREEEEAKEQRRAEYDREKEQGTAKEMSAEVKNELEAKADKLYNKYLYLVDEELAADPQQKHKRNYQQITKEQARNLIYDVYEGLIDESSIPEKIKEIQEINKTRLDLEKKRGMRLTFQEAKDYIEGVD
jgi:hypothetical protein